MVAQEAGEGGTQAWVVLSQGPLSACLLPPRCKRSARLLVLSFALRASSNQIYCIHLCISQPRFLGSILRPKFCDLYTSIQYLFIIFFLLLLFSYFKILINFRNNSTHEFLGEKNSSGIIWNTYHIVSLYLRKTHPCLCV